MEQWPHIPVLRDELRAYASTRPGERWVDATTGFGGHSSVLLDEGASVLGFDQDPFALAAAALRLAPHGDRFEGVRSNFSAIGEVLASQGVRTIDGCIADLGVSSLHLDDATRGFSFSADGPVDMRMDPDAPVTALSLLRENDAKTIAGWLSSYGEEPFARPIARALCEWARGSGPHSTRSMAEVVYSCLPRRVVAKLSHHPATRTFQALRIVVNSELDVLDRLLAVVPALLSPGGRFIVISFHSLEDRRVKTAFATLAGRRNAPAPRPGLPPPPAPPTEFELLTTKAVTASAAELLENPRSRSAKLRAVRRCSSPSDLKGTAA